MRFIFVLLACNDAEFIVIMIVSTCNKDTLKLSVIIIIIIIIYIIIIHFIIIGDL